LSDPIRTALLRGFCVAIVWVLAAGGARAEGLEAGLWKVVTKAEVNGVTAPNQETMRCLTPDDVKNLEVTFSPNSRTTNSICETSEHEASPQRLKWRLQCKGQLDMDVAGEFVFDAPEHYTATITTRATMLGKEIQHSQASIEAQRVGACQ
jgi:hypothetical protein